ncbi:MAG: DUF2141 domain-containing protein [Melioribacteraceae bacterium]|nr:DUF2141 domain-containing protein [Melioribacteraceae bacterium]
MKKQLTIITIIITLLFTQNLLSKDDVYNQNIAKIKATSDEAFLKFDEGLYHKSRGMCERMLAQYEDDALLSYYKAYSEYRLVLVAMVNKDKKKMNQYMEVAIDGCKNLIEKELLVSEANTLLAAIYMMKLAVDHSAGQVLTPKIHSLLDDALEINPKNPRTHIVRGQMLVNTPEFFGGSVSGAIKEYEKSVQIFENEKNEKLPSWGYLESLTSLGKAHYKNKNIVEAKKTYEKVLSIVPEYVYVKYKLLPELEKEEPAKQNVSNNSVGKLIINFTGFDSDEGTVRVALSNSSENYSDDKPFKRITSKIKGNIATVEFNDLPFGEYAVSAFHDEDNDKELGTGMFGIPTEGYGFSNNARGSFGPAEYEDAKFIVKDITTTISIEIE